MASPSSSTPITRWTSSRRCRCATSTAGWTLDWKEVGGEPDDILVVSREDGSGTRAVFEQQVMGEQPVTLTAIVMPSSSAVVEYVASHTAAMAQSLALA